MAAYHLDLETRSRADLPKVGAFKYAEDPDHLILVAAIARHGERPHAWVNPTYEVPGEVETDPEALVILGELRDDPDPVVYAHNAQFELANTEADYLRWVDSTQELEDRLALHIPRRAWRCTAAMARRAGLRGKLEHLSEDLELDQGKDSKGKALIRTFSVPNKQGTFTPFGASAKVIAKAKQFVAYCLRDVEAEQEVHTMLAPFEYKGDLLATFQFDVEMNARGIPVNVPALRNAQRIIDEVDAKTGEEFTRVTGLRHSQRDAVFLWLGAHGYYEKNMQADTVEAVLADCGCMTREGQLALELYAQLNFAAAKKVSAMLAAVSRDGTVKGTFVVYGAGTGRWAARGIQPQNFKKPTIPKADVPLAFDMICGGCSAADLEVMFGFPALEVVASCIRNFIGDGVNDVDYSGIEARLVNWGAGQDDVVEMFRLGVDQYIRMAAEIYEVEASTIDKKGMQRQLGKQAVLGCGYGMGPEKFVETCAKYGIIITLDLAERAVKTYRRLHAKVAAFWKALDRAAKNAVRNPGKIFNVNNGKARFVVRTLASGMTYLFMQLPSGRCLAYPKPEIKTVKSTRFEGNEDQLSYWGQIPGKVFMGRIKLYGGKIAENWTQAVAADIMANGAKRAAAAGHDIFALIHDQALAACPVQDDDLLTDFARCLTDLPRWAEGAPITAEGGWTPYYLKD